VAVFNGLAVLTCIAGFVVRDGKSSGCVLRWPSSRWRHYPERESITTGLRRTANTLEAFLRIFLGFIAAATIAGAIFLMLKMDSGSRSQGGRFYVAIAALFILGAVDSQFRKLVERRAPFSFGTTEAERRYAWSAFSYCWSQARFFSARRGTCFDPRAIVIHQTRFRYRSIFVVFGLLLEHSKPVRAIPKKLSQEREDNNVSRIRCPLCKWQPKPTHRWFCAPCGYPEYFADGCGTAWNTFNTRGRCPGCGHQWRWTACLRCEGWSLHTDWYEEKSGLKAAPP
jgi:hypothetical protein